MLLQGAAEFSLGMRNALCMEQLQLTDFDH